jgi:hypothetical protein
VSELKLPLAVPVLEGSPKVEVCATWPVVCPPGTAKVPDTDVSVPTLGLLMVMWPPCAFPGLSGLAPPHPVLHPPFPGSAQAAGAAMANARIGPAKHVAIAAMTVFLIGDTAFGLLLDRALSLPS